MTPGTPLGRRALIVDDYTDAGESLAALLRLWGYGTAVASDARDALRLAAAERPDVVILDGVMPGMTGWDLAARLQQAPGLERTLLLMVSGRDQPEDRRRSLEAGCHLHLAKPVDPVTLRHILARWQEQVERLAP
jgi:CheY-like chemotaxis protein